MTRHENLLAIFHYPDPGNGECVAAPGYGKSMSCTANVCEWKVKFWSNITPKNPSRFCWVSFDMKNLNRQHKIFALLLCISVFSIRRNSGLSGYSFSLFIDIHNWTEAKHDCKAFSAAADSPDAKDIKWAFISAEVVHKMNHFNTYNTRSQCSYLHHKCIP